MTRRGRTRSAEELREAAWSALAEDPERAVRLARQALALQDDGDGRYLLGVALLDSGEEEDGLIELEGALTADPTHVDAWAALGRAWFDRCDWEDARQAVTSALRLDPHHPDALYVRACLRERRGDHDGAARDYLAAAAEAPDDYPVPVRLDDEAINTVVEQVIDTLHPSLQRYLADVPILVDEVPDEELLSSFDPPMTPTDLVACFSGPSLTERSTLGPWSQLPATIVLYRCNLARLATDREGMLEELRITLLHEIGHFLGLDEADLEARGLD